MLLELDLSQDSRFTQMDLGLDWAVAELRREKISAKGFGEVKSVDGLWGIGIRSQAHHSRKLLFQRKLVQVGPGRTVTCETEQILAACGLRWGQCGTQSKAAGA